MRCFLWEGYLTIVAQAWCKLTNQPLVISHLLSTCIYYVMSYKLRVWYIETMFQIIQDISFHKLFIILKKSTVTVFDACVSVSCVYLCRSSFLRFNIRFRILPHFLTHYLTSTSWFWQMTLYTYVTNFRRWKG